MRKIIATPVRRVLLIFWFGLLLVIGSRRLVAQTAPTLPPGDGREVVTAACTQCHGFRAMLMFRASPAAWKRIVDRMILFGAEITPEDAEIIVQYLAKTFAPAAKPSITGGTLPAGPGKELIESRCTLCHDLSKIVVNQRTKEDWEGIVRAMVEWGTVATPQEMQTMVSYLTSQFGRKTK